MEKRDRIIEAAIDVFREKGIEKTKISDIVKVAGIAQGTFYLYFPSKLSVMPAIAEVMVNKMMEEMNQKVRMDASFQIQLEQIVDAVFQLTENYKDIFTLIYSGLTQTEYLGEWEDIYSPFYKWMNNFLIKAADKGIIRDSLHTEYTAKMVIGLIESTAEQIFLYDKKQIEDIELQKKELLDFLNHALRAELK